MKKIIINAALAALTIPLYAASTISLQTVTGSGADGTNGDYVSGAAALNSPYHFFIEVPPGLTHLVVDIFDADIGAGGAGEVAAGRDRDRTNYNTTARYSLFGPDGTARNPLFTTGDAAGPAGADNAWLTFFDSTGDSVRDNFTTAAYTNNDGNTNWAGNWIETNDNNSANNGNISITGGTLRIRDDGNAAPSTIEREANLSAWTTATFSFDFSTQNVDAGDQIAVDVSANGGGSWTRLETFTGPVAAGSRSYNITSSKASNTRIRFITVGTGYTGTDSFFVDNLQIKDSVIRNGHWELRIDESNAVTTGQDINAVGLRAHDGTPGAGGTELRVYADSMMSVGVNPPTTGTNSRTYTFYPYITSGCTCDENDFDYDENANNVGSMLFTSRSGITQPFNAAVLSGNNIWKRNTIPRWSTDNNATDYGIWTQSVTINSYTNPGQNGNYATLYQSNFQGLANPNPPTANPQTGAFRIYLPSDSGAAPVMPYLDQQVATGGPALAVGGTKKFTITLRIVNPTAQAITFSATNLITANVPGSGVVYAGNALVGQGSIVSQPAVGGTGNITWNPGTLAAGATTIMSYQVNVTASSAARIPLTATPASGNGTRATFVDSTGNTTQARATFTFGPLCEIAVTPGLATEVLVSSFNVSVHGNSTLLKWETASEAGTVGFNLYRVDRTTGDLTLANESLLPANPGAPQGGKYRFVDKGNTDDEPSYMLEEITTDGRNLRYGPFAGNTDPDDALPDDDFDGAPHSDPKDNAPSSHAHKPKPAAAMASVNKTAITRVMAADLADALAMPQAAVDSAIKTGRISVTDRGEDVAWLAASDNDSILFFGEASDSFFSKDHVYRISLDKGTPMRVIDVAGAPESPTSFFTTRQFEVDAFAATVLPLDPDGDFWFWDFVISGNATFGKKSYTIDVPAVASGAGASLQVRLQGAMQASHRARVSINGTLLGDATWNALDGSSTELSIPSGALHDGANVVTVQGLLAPGTSSDVFYVDGFAIRYLRTARAVNGAIEVSTTPGAVVTTTDLGTDAMAFDITNRKQPAFISGGGTSFVAPAGATTLFFADSTAIAGPTAVRSSVRPALADRKNRADYVVIANDALHEGADALARFRSADGLQTMVVDLDDIYDEFAGGNATPHAIHDFLAATRSWAKAPRYAVLAGIGTLDYRGITTGPGLLPPLLAKTSNGLFAADALFADFDGDGIPELALGRIPVSTNAELLAYVAKLDASAHAPVGAAVFSADGVDRSANFKHESTIVESPLGGRPVTDVYVDDLGAPGARARLLAEWQKGTSLVNWIGHGGVDRLSNASLLTVKDTPLLTTPTGGQPVFVAMTCTINRFELGSVQSLGTSLTVAPNSGALAVWSASGLSLYADATLLEQTLIQLAANSDHARLGDLIVQTLNANKSMGETATVYLLLGDPAISFTLPAIVPAAGQPSGGIE